ncbi:hypothetical protein ACOMHN_029172 [Nucella lapillus]
MSPEKTRKTRRNGMWNIFEGVDNTVLEKLGMSEEVVHQLVTEADDTVTQHLATHQDDDTLDVAGGCHCRKARILRSFSATVGEDVKAALQNRQRRNAVGNLFDVLTPSQKLLLVEHLQEQLDRLHCVCGKALKSSSATAHEDTGSITILSLADFTSSSSSSSSSSQSQAGSAAVSSPPSSAEEVVCH